MDKIFKALTDRNRRKILNLLRRSDLSVGEILSHFEISQATVSSHLAILRKAELVRCEVKGKMRIYKLNKEIWIRFVEKLDEFINSQEVKEDGEIIMRRRRDVSC